MISIYDNIYVYIYVYHVYMIYIYMIYVYHVYQDINIYQLYIQYPSISLFAFLNAFRDSQAEKRPQMTFSDCWRCCKQLRSLGKRIKK